MPGRDKHLPPRRPAPPGRPHLGGRGPSAGPERRARRAAGAVRRRPGQQPRHRARSGSCPPPVDHLRAAHGVRSPLQPSRPLGDPGKGSRSRAVPRLRAERTWYTPRVKPLAREPLAWLATAELIGVVCWLRPAELIGVACWLRSAELIGVVRWLRSAEPVADFRSARAVRTCHLDLHHRYLLPTAAVTLASRRMLRPVGRVAVSTSRKVAGMRPSNCSRAGSTAANSAAETCSAFSCRPSAAGYRLGSDRGSPNHGSTLLSKRVMAQIRSAVRVRT
jgi:hypothetical protein